MSVARCRSEVDGPEFRDWIAYYNIEPFGELRQDIRFGIACCLFASVHRKKGAAKPKIDDFMVERFLKKSADDAESVDSMLATMLTFTRMQNSSLAREDR